MSTKHWFDYTPIGLLANGATKLLGLDSNPFSTAMEGVSDTLFGTTYNQERLQQQQMDFNAAQAQINRDWQKQMMDYQNQFNSPSAMMQRFRDAGLNPSLMMSGAAPAIGSASPSGGSAASSALSSAQHGNISLSDALLASQIKNIDADTEKKKSETKATEIQNKVDGMNAEAFTEFYNMNKNDIIRTMQQKLGIEYNDFVLSNYEAMEAAWNFSIMFGLKYSDALKAGQSLYGEFTSEDLERIFDSIDVSEMYKLHRDLFVGSYEAQISANAAAKLLNDIQFKKSRKDFDIWSYLNDKAQNGDKWEKIGAQVALMALFVSEQNFNIPMPNLRFMNFKRENRNTIYHDEWHNDTHYGKQYHFK